MDYDKKLTACGTKIVLKKLEQEHMVKYGDLFLPPKSVRGFNLNKAEVLSIGKDAEFEGLKVGDIVLYDYYSVFYDSHPIVVTNVENVICVWNEE